VTDKVKIVNAFLKIIYSYVFAGVFNFWLSVGYLYLRDSFLNFDFINSQTFISNVFLWPISSFQSGYQLFGNEGGNIWLLFSTTSLFLFLGSIIYLFQKDFPKNKIE
jgi:hypothetical protein